MRQLHWIMIALALGVVSESFAETGKNSTESANLNGLIGCKNVPQAEARLACFDAEVAKIDRSLSHKDVVIVSRDDVKQAQKSVFGLTLPKLGLFGGSDAQNMGRTSDEEGIGYIEAKLTDARQTQDGKWLLVLEDGARWAQTDTANIRTPKPGDVVRIRKAALGSYMANINGRPAIRVRRLS